MGNKRIDGLFDGIAMFQLFHMIDEQIKVDGMGMIKIDPAPFLIAQMVILLVIGIL
jgi:hypothetical protein